MKKLIVVIGLLISGSIFSQETVLTDTNKFVYHISHMKAGSCASPDGAENSTAIVPPSYAWLQANGYCNPASYGNNPTVCWTFTPTSSSITLNSGHSTSGCVNVSFGSFNLYDNSCILIGTGLNFTGLTPGQQYTWCMSGSAWGGGPSCIGFTDFCPYYFNNVTLPIELELFSGYNDGVKKNHIYWVTASETNNDYFILERSRSGKYWEFVYEVSGAGTVHTPTAYEFNDDSYIDGVNYYRLTQVDYDGQSETFDIISINTTPDIDLEEAKPYSLTGKLIKHPELYRGMIIWRYENRNAYKSIYTK